ncbi:MAG: hypothetical protein WD876_02925 [Candidatus Pacearchaeota archaeon]
MGDSNEIYITHYFNNIPPEFGLLDLDFLTATKESLPQDRYFMAHDFFESISSKEIKYDIQSGAIVKLPTPFLVLTRKKKALWMDCEGIVYVADSEKPYSDLEKKAIYDSKTKNSLI